MLTVVPILVTVLSTLLVLMEGHVRMVLVYSTLVNVLKVLMVPIVRKISIIIVIVLTALIMASVWKVMALMLVATALSIMLAHVVKWSLHSAMMIVAQMEELVVS